MYYPWKATKRGSEKKKMFKIKSNVARQYLIDCAEFWPNSGGTVYACSQGNTLLGNLFSME
jgi:hypothetical protein